MGCHKVDPVLKKSVRGLCTKPYPNHPHGCPNWNQRDACPPKAPLLGDVIDLTEPVWMICNAFDFGSHTKRMRSRHPEWAVRQVECCLYWQGTARKQLRSKVADFLGAQPKGSNLLVLNCPEACGVDITATMASVGIDMEWPPEAIAYQVALIGTQKDKTS